MQRLVDTLASSPYRVIVSKGPRHGARGGPHRGRHDSLLGSPPASL
jgi:hypothetical protein